MLGIKGIGPKKIGIIWHELGIETVGELYYACNENRLIEAKGFGLKTQEEIVKVIEFRMASNGKFLFARVDAIAGELFQKIQDMLPESILSFTGEFRRCCEDLAQRVRGARVTGLDGLHGLPVRVQDVNLAGAVDFLEPRRLRAQPLQLGGLIERGQVHRHIGTVQRVDDGIV